MQKASSHRAHLNFVQMKPSISDWGSRIGELSKQLKVCPFRSAIPNPRSQISSFDQRPNEPGSYTLYAIGCRYYFTPLTGVLFTFPSRYWFTIGRQGVFSLIQWSGRIHAEFHVHRITWDASRGHFNFTHPAVTVYGRFFHIVMLTLYLPYQGPATPEG